MNARGTAGRLLVGMAVAVLLGGCAAGASPTPAPATPTPIVTPAAAATAAASPATTSPGWTMVTISDSALGKGLWPNDVVAADAYAKWIEQDLGVRVTVHPFFYGGSTSGFVLQKIRSDASLREALQSADVIVFTVPSGEGKDLCPWDAAGYRPAPGTPAEYRACGKQLVASYAANAAAIVDEIVALRSPADALIRATDRWDVFYPTYQAMGLGTVTHDMSVALNAGLTRAAAAHGIPVAQAHATFMGPDGTTDPVAAGDVQRDERHLTDQGITTLAGLLRGLGYEKAGPTPAP